MTGTPHHLFERRLYRRIQLPTFRKHKCSLLLQSQYRAVARHMAPIAKLVVALLFNANYLYSLFISCYQQTNNSGGTTALFHALTLLV